MGIVENGINPIFIVISIVFIPLTILSILGHSFYLARNKEIPYQTVEVNSIREVRGLSEEYYKEFEESIGKNIVKTIVFLDGKKVIVNHKQGRKW